MKRKLKEKCKDSINQNMQKEYTVKGQRGITLLALIITIILLLIISGVTLNLALRR